MADEQAAPSTDVERIVADGLRTGQPVKMEDLANAIKQIAPPPAGVQVSDGKIIKLFAAGNPHLGLDKLSFDIPESPAVPAATSAPVKSQVSSGSLAHTPSILEQSVINPAKELYSGYMQGTGRLSNTLANLMQGLGAVSGIPTLPALPPKAAAAAADYLRNQSTAFSKSAEQALPPPSFTSPIYRGLGSAVPSVATYAPAMAAGPAAPLAMGGIGALEEADKGFWPAVQSGVGAALAGKYLGLVDKVPGLKKLVMAGAPNVAIDLIHGLQTGLPASQILQNMVASGTTMAALVGANPEAAQSAISEAVRLAKSLPNPMVNIGGKWQNAIAPLPGPRLLRAEVPSEAPATAPPPGAAPATPSPSTAAPVLSKQAQQAMDILARETAQNPKYKASPSAIAKDLNLDKIKGGKIYSELRLSGMIDPSGAPIPQKGAIPSTPATAPPPAAGRLPVFSPSVGDRPWEKTPAPQGTPPPAATATPPVAAAPRVAGVPAPTPDQVAAIQSAFDSATEPAAAEPAQPMVSRPTAESPKSSAVPVNGAAPPPTPESVAQQLVGGVRQDAMAAQARGVEQPQPPAVLPEVTPPAPAEVIPISAGRTSAPPSGEVPLPPEKGVIQSPSSTEAAGAPQAPTSSTFETDLATLKAWAANLGKGEAGTQYYDWRRPTEPGTVPPEQVFTALRNVGAELFKRAGNSFETWKNEMVSKVGSWAEGHLMPIWLQLTTASQEPAVGAKAPGASTPPPGAASSVGTALPPSPPPYLQWDQGARTEASAIAQGPPVPNPRTAAEKATNAEWVRQKVAEAAQQQQQQEMDFYRGRGAAERAQQGVQRLGNVREQLSRVLGRDVTAPPPGSAAPAPVLPPTPGEPPHPPAIMAHFPGSSEPPRPLIPRPLEGNQLREALQSAGLGEPLPTEHAQYTGEQALLAAGFQERNIGQKFAGTERPHTGGKTNAPRGPIARTLPISGQLATEVWVKPVADGVIEIQRDPGAKVYRKVSGDGGESKPDLVNNEFVATKYYNDTGEARTIHGAGLGEMIDYLNGVIQKESPIPKSQLAGRSGTGGFSTANVSPAAPTAQPPGVSASDLAQQQLTGTVGRVQSPGELLSVLENVQKRSVTPGQGSPVTTAQKLAEMQAENARLKGSGKPPSAASAETLPVPPELDMNLAEKNAKAFSELQPSHIQRIIADAVTRMAANGELPGPTNFQPLRNRRIKLPEQSPFTVQPSGEGTYIVTAKVGGPSAEQAAAMRAAFGGGEADPAAMQAAFGMGASSATEPPPGAPKGPDAGKVADIVDTGIHITRVKNNRYEIKIGSSDRVERAKATLLGAKDEAVKLADRMVHQEATKNTPFRVEGVGTYSPLGLSADKKTMNYQFIPDTTGTPIEHSMPADRWQHIKSTGTPVNPFAPPKNPVGRPATAAPPVIPFNYIRAEDLGAISGLPAEQVPGAINWKRRTMPPPQGVTQ